MAFPTPRTNQTLVAEIIDITAGFDITPFIQTANSIVTRWCTDSTFGYTNDQLELIERWLSAHFYSIYDQLPQSEHAGVVSASYQGKTGMMLQATTYGQQAMVADYMGGLAALQKRLTEGVAPRPGVRWMGTCNKTYYGLQSGE